MGSTPLKPYPAYKPAGVPWLKQVPEHWDEMKVKYIFRERVQKGYPDEPLLAATQSMGVVTKETYGERTVTAQKDLHLLKLVEKGDFVISLRSFQGGIEISHAKGIISPAYTILKIARDCAPGYFAYLLKSAPFIDGLRLFITGIREGQNIDYARLARTYLPWPSVAEQHLIVRYLHALDAKVKRYIRSKRSLIARLQEQKQAIIQQAVTRGLDPKVKLKPSGVEWLREVPEHWEMKQLKQVTSILRGKFSHRPRNDPRFYGGAYPFIQTGAIARAKKFITAHSQTLNERGLGVSKLFPQGTLVMAIAANIGDVAFLTFDSCAPDSVVGFIPTKHTASDFLYLVLCAMKPELLAEAPVNTQGNLSIQRVGSMSLPCPPFKEQTAIAGHVNSHVTQIEGMIAVLETSIARVNEYHTRLIADVVTGAVDVRAAAQAMPDQAIRQLDDQTMEEEPLSMAAEGEEGYGEEEEQ